MKRMVTIAAALLALGGCSVGVKRTPGMKLYSAGDHAAAVPMLEQEVAAGEVSARYPLGLAYRDGTGVAKDAARAEVLLTGAAIGGDPRAVTEVRKLLTAANRCPGDKALHDAWGNVGFAHRNIITGVVELNTAPPAILRQMAELYERPCPGAPVQAEAAASLHALSLGERRMWIYVPG